MKEVLLLKYGEIVLKGLNRGYFNSVLEKRVRRALKPVDGEFFFDYAQSTLCISGSDDADMDTAFEKVKKIFGIAAVSKAAVVEKDFEVIAKTAVEYLGETLKNAKTFKVPDGGNLKDILSECIEDGEAVLRDCSIINTISEKQIPIEINFALIATEENDNEESLNRKIVGVIRDVSVQKETDRLRDDFIATLTHDMRTPLTAAIQTLEFFLDGTVGELNERQHMLLSTMKSNNEGLLGLVNSLLTVYKFDAGKVELVKTNFNVKELINQRYNELKPLADKKNIDFTVSYEIEDDLLITADRQEIGRVIANLCGNAVNYTNPNGKIEILVKEQSGDFLFSVSDTGNGIPKEDIPRIFERFYRVDKSHSRQTGGTGLGLAIVKHVAEVHHADVKLESEPGKGTKMIVTF